MSHGGVWCQTLCRPTHSSHFHNDNPFPTTLVYWLCLIQLVGLWGTPWPIHGSKKSPVSLPAWVMPSLMVPNNATVMKTAVTNPCFLAQKIQASWHRDAVAHLPHQPLSLLQPAKSVTHNSLVWNGAPHSFTFMLNPQPYTFKYGSWLDVGL